MLQYLLTRKPKGRQVTVSVSQELEKCPINLLLPATHLHFQGAPALGFFFLQWDKTDMLYAEVWTVVVVSVSKVCLASF